jgi:hypothetical protein
VFRSRTRVPRRPSLKALVTPDLREIHGERLFPVQGVDDRRTVQSAYFVDD